jgi:hypothetical protein
MKNIKNTFIQSIIRYSGILMIIIISIIATLIFDCKKYGEHIAFFDILSISMWILVSNFIVKNYLNKK